MRAIPREVFLHLKSSFKINNIQKTVLVGTLLGDGNIHLKGRFARLHIKHSANQLSLVNYKREVFSNISNMKVNLFTQKVGKVDYNFAEFVTLTHIDFLKFYKLFYPKNKKIVPLNIKTLFGSPLSLAVWIMDDGSAEYAGLSIQTHSFTNEEVNILRNTILENFGIETGARENKGKTIIYFPKASLPKLVSLIGKYTLEDFKYKFLPYSLRKKTP